MTLFAHKGVLPSVVSAQQGARVIPRLQREPAVPLEVPEHAQDQGVQGAHVQVRTQRDLVGGGFAAAAIVVVIVVVTINNTIRFHLAT